jgi:hypothetical protein
MPRGGVARVVEVDERHVERLARERLGGVRGRGDRPRLEALALQEQAQRLDHGRLVICD